MEPALLCPSRRPPSARPPVDGWYPEAYGDLYRQARRQRRRWRGNDTLNTTALVHEAYLRLALQDGWASRAHFLAVAARAMRHVLINYAARQDAGKRGGGTRKASLERLCEGGFEPSAGALPVDDLLTLEAALRRLERVLPRLGRIVECRFFGGLSIPETARVLGLSPATVKRGWTAARAWLYREMAA